jgi:hypothetical protein
MGSRERPWSIYGDAWGWPPPTMTHERARADLARHDAEENAHESFNDAVFDAAETALLGCIYVDPPIRPDTDAETSWVIDDRVDPELDSTLDDFVPAWIADVWPFRSPHIGPPDS